MIAGAKAVIARHWPVLRLRTILFGTLLFVVALPGLGAIFLRVYENALVRRTEADHGRPRRTSVPDNLHAVGRR